MNFLATQHYLEKTICCRQYHSTRHALIDQTENNRKALDQNEFAVGVFIDLPKR